VSDEKLQISLSLPADLIGQVDELADLAQRDRSWIVQRALEHYLTDEGADLRDDAGGIAELDAGQSSDLDDVLKKASGIIDRAEAQKARRAG
jgi:predicted transcriptional regulator